MLCTAYGRNDSYPHSLCLVEPRSEGSSLIGTLIEIVFGHKFGVDEMSNCLHTILVKAIGGNSLM